MCYLGQYDLPTLNNVCFVMFIVFMGAVCKYIAKYLASYYVPCLMMGRDH